MIRFWLASLFVAAAIIAVVIPKAEARAVGACVSDYRALPSNQGYRRYRLVGGHRCWYAGRSMHERTRAAHRRIAAVNKKPTKVPLPIPERITVGSAPPAQQPDVPRSAAIDVAPNVTPNDRVSETWSVWSKVDTATWWREAFRPKAPESAYPRVMQDEESGYWFVAESSGPSTWHYHRFWWTAALELLKTRLWGSP